MTKNGGELVVFDCQVKVKDGWVEEVDMLPVPPNNAYIMANESHIFTDDEVTHYFRNNDESAVLNDYSIVKLKQKYNRM